MIKVNFYHTNDQLIGEAYHRVLLVIFLTFCRIIEIFSESSLSITALIVTLVCKMEYLWSLMII